MATEGFIRPMVAKVQGLDVAECMGSKVQGLENEKMDSLGFQSSRQRRQYTDYTKIHRKP